MFMKKHSLSTIWGFNSEYYRLFIQESKYLLTSMFMEINLCIQAQINVFIFLKLITLSIISCKLTYA